MKYAFIIFSDPDIKSELVKAAHALHYAINLKKKGNDVVIYFEGLGEKILISDNSYIKPLVDEATKQGIIYSACGYCASPPHLNIRDKVVAKGFRLLGDENDHKDLSLFIEEGYQIILV
ncbi:hypothetical protein [Sulfurisphaera ohwakuensis]|uniref:hypothetical protein n=1 Tax=Sulfurisphaera ohwakuensis TaxID=69656 RepID=UPI0036F1B91A